MTASRAHTSRLPAACWLACVLAAALLIGCAVEAKVEQDVDLGPFAAAAAAAAGHSAHGARSFAVVVPGDSFDGFDDSFGGADRPQAVSLRPDLGAEAAYMPTHPELPDTALSLPTWTSECPYHYGSLPLVLTSNPCVLEMSRRLAVVMRGRTAEEALTEQTMLLQRKVPEAFKSLHIKSGHLNPRNWVWVLASLQKQVDLVVSANRRYSVSQRGAPINPATQQPYAATKNDFFAHAVNISYLDESFTPTEPPLVDGTPVGLQSDWDRPVIQSRDENVVALGRLAADLRLLALAYNYLGDPRYGQYAAGLVWTWFINEPTRMSPNLQTAATYAGGAAFLATQPLVSIIDSLSMLARSSAFTEDIKAHMRTWFGGFVQWMTTSETALAQLRRQDLVGVYAMSQVISLAAYVGDMALARRSIYYAAAKVPSVLTGRGDVVVPDFLKVSVDHIQYARLHTIRALVLVGLQSQFMTDALVDLSYLKLLSRDPAAGAATIEDIIKDAIVSEALKKKESRFGADVSIDLFQLRTDVSQSGPIIMTALYNFIYQLEVPMQQWFALESTRLVPSLGQSLAQLMFMASAQWEAKEYAYHSFRTGFICPIVPALNQVPCLASIADLLQPLQLRIADSWTRMSTIAPVRNTLTPEAEEPTVFKSLIVIFGVFDTNALPFFLTLGLIGILRWGSFFFRFIPGLWFLYRERRVGGRKYLRSVQYRSERDVTVIVPTIDSGPELQVAITSWLVNRPKKMVFATIHREKQNIARLLQKTCADFDAALEAGQIPPQWLKTYEADMARYRDGLSKIEPLPHVRLTEVGVVSVAHGNKRQQMVSALAFIDTPLFVFADDDAIWPDTCMERMIAPFDNPNIGGVGTEQMMRPVPKDDPDRSWMVIGDATVWEIVADMRLTTKLLENAAATWFGNSISCLSGRTAAYRTCIFKPTPEEGPCNPHANWCFKVDEHGYRPEDYRPPSEIAKEINQRLVRAVRNPDGLDDIAVRRLINAHKQFEQIAPSLQSTTRPLSAEPSTSLQTLGAQSSVEPPHIPRGVSAPSGLASPGLRSRRNDPTQLVPPPPLVSRPISRDASSSNVSTMTEDEFRRRQLQSSMTPIQGGEDGLGGSRSITPAKQLLECELDDVLQSLETYSKQADETQARRAARMAANTRLLFYSFCVQFCNDYFVQPWNSAQLHSGDDKFLTRWIVNRDWQMYCQTGPDARIESTFKPNSNFLKQYLRWTRNTWRSDFRSLFKERAVWKDPHYWFLIYLMFDKMISPFTLIFGPILVTWVCLHSSLGVEATGAEGEYRLPIWNVIASYVIWICFTRAFRIFPHFVRKPMHILCIPFYVMLQYLLAVLKIYCIFTLDRTEWGSRAISNEQAAASHKTIGIEEKKQIVAERIEQTKLTTITLPAATPKNFSAHPGKDLPKLAIGETPKAQRQC